MNQRFFEMALVASLVSATSVPVMGAETDPSLPAGNTSPMSSKVQIEPEGAAPAKYQIIEVAEPTAAQPDPSDTPAAGERKNRMIEEIIITAQKREENLQDVPISVQAFSAEQLDAKGIEEPKALQLSTPGMQYNIIAGYSIIYIRGVGTDAFIPSADASVATYIDNVYYPFGSGLASALGEVERIEILKGPQGTLFGRNSTAGAINIITKQPGPDLKSSVTVSLENYGKVNLRAYTNLPLTDTFSVSLSGLKYEEDGYYELRDSPRKDLPKESSKAFSVKAGWNPIEDLKAVFGYSYINTSGTLSALFPATDPKPLGIALGVKEQPAYKTSIDAPTYIDTTAKVLTADIKYSTPWFDTRLIGGRQKILSPTLVDFDGSNQPLVSFEAPGQYANVKTGEFQVLSNENSWASERFKWIGGLYYIDSAAGFSPLNFNVGPNFYNYLLSPPASGLLSAVDLGRLTQALNQTLAQVSTATGVPLSTLVSEYVNYGTALSLNGLLGTKSCAGFFQSTVGITDSLSLTVGGRYQKETRRQLASNTRIAPLASAPAFTPAVINFPLQHQSSSNFSPKIVLDYKLTEGNMTYVSYSKGFKSGTYNIISIYTPSQYVKPEIVTSYEVGYKGTFLDGTLRLNAALFQNNIADLQAEIVAVASGGVTKFETAGSARIRGADFDAVWQLAPESLPGLALTAGGAFLDGIYTDYKNGSGFDETTGLYFGGTGGVIGGGVTPGRDFTGNHVVRTPKFSGNSGLSYLFELSSGTLEVAGDIYCNSGSYFSAQNTKTSEQSAYYITNARISYLYEPYNLRLTTFVKNINDAKYNYLISEFDFDTAKLLAPPRTYGAKLQWMF